MYVHGKKVFLDTENTITIYNKLANKFKDVSILESVIGGDNKGRYSIILFNILQNVEIFHNYVLINNQKKKIKSPDSFIKDIYKNLKLVLNNYNKPKSYYMIYTNSYSNLY